MAREKKLNRRPGRPRLIASNQVATADKETAMVRSYAPTTEDIDNFHFAAHASLAELLRGELDLDALEPPADLDEPQ